MRGASTNVLLCWEPYEVNSWNPVLAEHLQRRGMSVTEIHDLDAVLRCDLSRFDVCLPLFRVGAANMARVDQVMSTYGIPVLNSFDSRRQCENKALAHLAFEQHGIPQPPSFVMSSEGICDRALNWSGEAVLKPLHGTCCARAPLPANVGHVAMEMLEAVDGDLLAVDVLETETDAYALEINHNFDAHGGDEPAVGAFCREIEAKIPVLAGAEL